MTKPLDYGGEPIASPELGLYVPIDESERVQYTGENLEEWEQDQAFDPQKDEKDHVGELSRPSQ